MERLQSLLWNALMAMAVIGLVVTLAMPGAVAGPAVKITQPSHGQVVTGEIIINVAYRSDSDQPVTRLEILVDGKLAREYNLAAPRLEGVQSFSWDFSFAASSAHAIGARAIDASGEAGSAEITVTVQSAATRPGRDQVPPVVSIYYPAQGAHVSGDVEIRGEATDNVGVKYVFFYIDGDLHKMIMNAPPFSYLWDTTRSSDGPHVIQAKAMDEDENAARSAEVTVFVENHAMTITPAEGTLPATSRPTEATVVEPAPQIVPPTPAPPQPSVTPRDFGREDAAAPTPRSFRQVQRAEGDVSLAAIGYVPAIAYSEEAARISMPRMLAALPMIEPLPESRGLPALPAETPTPRLTERGEAEPLGPEIAALETGPRLTTPRGHVAPSAATGVPPVAEAGWVRVDPVLHVAPEGASPAPRTTSPQTQIAALPPKPASVAPPVLGAAALAEAETIIVKRPDSGELGTMVARPEQRTTQPGLLLELGAPPQLASAESDAQVLRVALLPREAAHAAIPADGRVTNPGGAELIAVAAMSFEEVEVLFDSEALELRAQPEMKEGISIAPLREIFEHTDGVLYWFPVEKRVRAVNAETDIRLQIGDPAVRVNDEARALEIAPYIKRGRTMVPLQFIADTLDVTITFNPDSGQICITSNKF